jgi:hypothetical protein
VHHKSIIYVYNKPTRCDSGSTEIPGRHEFLNAFFAKAVIQTDGKETKFFLRPFEFWPGNITHWEETRFSFLQLLLT